MAYKVVHQEQKVDLEQEFLKDLGKFSPEASVDLGWVMESLRERKIVFNDEEVNRILNSLIRRNYLDIKVIVTNRLDIAPSLKVLMKLKNNPVKRRN